MSNSREIVVSPETLMEQAGKTAHDYMLHAVEDIDKIFGDGYAAKHPELVGAYIQTCAADFHTAFTVQQRQDADETLGDINRTLGRLADALAEDR